MATLNEKTKFIRDTESTIDGKNAQLADHLMGPLLALAIVQIQRIEIGDSGWLVTYRE